LRLALVPHRAQQSRRRRQHDTERRQPDPQSEAARPRLVIDRDAKLPGRGAYLCRDATGTLPSIRCFELARKRGGVARTLRSNAKLEWGDLVESVS
jgi:predicted RNA-binding protein YlxR (DUF448 family)